MMPLSRLRLGTNGCVRSASVPRPSRACSGTGSIAARKELSLASDAELSRGFPSRTTRTRAASRALTVGETCFFRESAQLDCFAPSSCRWLVCCAATGGGRLRRCSTGEEAYRSPSSCAGARRRRVNWEVRVVGFDLNSRAIATARRGVYRP